MVLISSWLGEISPAQLKSLATVADASQRFAGVAFCTPQVRSSGGRSNCSTFQILLKFCDENTPNFTTNHNQSRLCFCPVLFAVLRDIHACQEGYGGGHRKFFTIPPSATILPNAVELG
jgi:hypothetical protein